MEEPKLKKLKARELSKYASLMERRLWRDWLWRRRWTRHSRSSMNRYLRRHYDLESHQARLVLDYMTGRNMLTPQVRRGRRYWISTTVDAANKVITRLEAGPTNKRRIVTDVGAAWSQTNRALRRLVEKGIIAEAKTKCPVVEEEGISAKVMIVYGLVRPTRAQIRRIKEEIRAQMPESERIYGERVERWLRREYGPEATIERESIVPNLAPENRFDFLVTTPDGTKIPVEIKGWRREPITLANARVEQFKWKMNAARVERGLFFAPYAQKGLPEKMEEMGIHYKKLKFPAERRRKTTI